MLHSKRQLRQEVALLAYLAIATKRSLLIPNILIGVGKGIPGQIGPLGCKEDPYMKTSYCQEIGDYRNTLEGVDNTFNPEVGGEYYWPGFRVVDERNRIPGLEVCIVYVMVCCVCSVVYVILCIVCEIAWRLCLISMFTVHICYICVYYLVCIVLLCYCMIPYTYHYIHTKYIYIYTVHSLFVDH